MPASAKRLAPLVVLTATLVAATVAACGGESSATTSPAAAPSVGATANSLVGPPSDEVAATLEGRIEAMNRGDGEAAAFYAVDGIMEELDVTPHIVTKGRQRIADRLQWLLDAGMRLKPAGTPMQYTRYVAEPVTFHAGDPSNPIRGAGMLVFEIDESNKIAHQ